jgi:hypothetical protein
MKIGSQHTVPIRGLDNVSESSISGGRFGRMFRNLGPAPFREPYLRALGKTMIANDFDEASGTGATADIPFTQADPAKENPKIPSGFTYLGQFIDHDITFDPVSSLDRENDPDALHDFRTPRLDLDSVYGAGPAQQPYLYQPDGARLRIGVDKAPRGFGRFRPDLPRAWDAPPQAARPTGDGAPVNRVRALIADPRNDENNLVQQIHALFQLFHNRVCDRIAEDEPPSMLFGRAQNLTRWHYQWMVLHDFIPRICGEAVYKNVVVAKGDKPRLQFFRSRSGEGFMPVEFSVAAYRMGHSMVRPTYSLNDIVRGAQPSRQDGFDFHRIPIFSGNDTDLANLNGFRELPGFWGIDWAFYFDLPHDHVRLQAGETAFLPQPSYRLDTLLTDPLARLPDRIRAGASISSLAELNLLRGWRLGLPSGQAVARNMGVEEADVLTDAELFDHPNPKVASRRRALLDGDPAEIRALFGDAVSGLNFEGDGRTPGDSFFAGNCPLWYYVLREAEIGGGEHLGLVGGTIVAEVLAGLITMDRKSFLQIAPKWKPVFGEVPGEFTMTDLIRFVDGEFDGAPAGAAASIGDPTVAGNTTAGSASGS